MTKSEVPNLIQNKELKWWLELMDHLTRSKERVNMGMEVNFLRLYGDLMERELIWTRGCLVKPQCPTGRIAFLYMKDIVNALAKIWLPRWSVAKI